MNPQLQKSNLEEILRLSALTNFLKTQSEASELGIIICDNGYDILYCHMKKGWSSGSRDEGVIIENFLSEVSTLEFSPLCKVAEIFSNDLYMLVTPLSIEESHVAYLLCGPYHKKGLNARENQTISDPSLKIDERFKVARIAEVNRKLLSRHKRMVMATSGIIVQFYKERLQHSRDSSRISSLYKIGTTIASSVEKKKVLKLVLDSAINLLGAHNGSIMLLDDQELRIFVAYGLSDEIVENTRVKVGEGISGNVAKTGKSRLLLKGVKASNGVAGKKGEEIPTAISVPLKLKNRVIGVINVSGKPQRKDFSAKDMNLLELMASNAAIAIHNADLYMGISEKAKELETLYRIGTIITSSMEKKKVLKEVLRSSRHLLKAKKGSFMMLDKGLGELRIEIASGLSKRIQNTVRPKLGEGIAGKVAVEGIPRLMQKGIKVSESSSEKKAREIPSAISVPVKIKENVIGVLNLSDKESGDNFTEESVSLLMMLANQAAIALENSRLMEELQELFVQSITALANAIDARDPYTRGHSQRVTEYSLRIARKMGMAKDELDLIQYAALLHDIGKIHIKDDILHKPGRLTDEEFEEMQKHPAYGARIMEPVKRFNTILPYMYHHHEKFAGKGYPYHLIGENIPLAARIISVADSFDAMTSDRPYRRGLPVEDAVCELKRCAGSQFDPEVVEAFLKVLQGEKPVWLKKLFEETT